MRAYSDKEGCVEIVDCVAVSCSFEVKVDASDPIEQPYTLEVSSPGLDRPLKKDSDFEKFKGEIVDLKLYKAQDGCKQFQGALLGLENGVISIEDDSNKVFSFEQKDVANVRLAVIF